MAHDTTPQARVAGGDATGIPIASGKSLLRPLKAAEVVARDVVRDITANRLAPGDSLESEAEMLQKYGVSRESLREGLRLLEVQGMINIRRGPGGGPSVGTVDPGNLGRVEALFFHLAGATYQELFQAWILAETTLAGLAAANEDADLRSERMEPFLDRDAHRHEHQELADFVEGHEGFHAAVAALSGNRVLELTFRAYGQLVSHHVATVGDPRPIQDALVETHLGIAEAIIRGYSDAAGQLMREHLEEVIAINIEQLGDLVAGPVEWL
ncbi:FCD domain-containing protein [Nocardioides sp. YIM 152315]|uniref:FadR/GntR family transcriptional regulator n=1 Tax=Nocardioides sp. YIM 152315 TaxID=3031760 RepID=UPI0023D9AE83|nr:FCD domain-containing protein [Nocardioides sp. YIM 152315]MDF1602243.1 FCD domain-containing protein [Nocardioides sp. YIM 152315]